MPMAITHSPSRSLSRVAELDRLERLVGLDPQQREIGLLVAADDLGLQPGAVIEDDGDLVGVGDHVIVGHDDAGRIDDEAGAERVDPARRCVRDLAVALTAAAVLEEIVEELLERRAGRQLRHRRCLARARPFCEVEMLTTASITFSATSAMLSGPRARWTSIAPARPSLPLRP